MSFSQCLFTYLVALGIVALMALYAPIIGIAAGLFSIGWAAWTNDWSYAPMATLGIVMWSIATQYPWPIIGITALVGLFSYARIYKHSNAEFPLA